VPLPALRSDAGTCADCVFGSGEAEGRRIEGTKPHRFTGARVMIYAPELIGLNFGCESQVQR
jgi:hypothetical protein